MTYPKGVNTAPRHYSHTKKRFIYYVLAFRQCKTIYSIYHIIFINKNFIFENFTFSKILSHFVFKKKKFRNLLFTVTIDSYCSQLTVDHYCSQLTVDRYCSLQYNNCIAIQFSAPQAFSCNTIFPLHTFILQYNFSTAHFYIAIHFSATTHPILQYNFPSLSIQFQPIKPPKLQYNFPYCNTLANKPSIAIQFSTHQAISQYNLGNGPKPFLHFLSRIFFFLLNCWKITQKYIYTFFFHTCYWKNTQKHNYTFFFFFFQLLEDTQKKYTYIFFLFSATRTPKKYLSIFFFHSTVPQ